MKTLTISRKLALLTVALIGAGVGVAAYLMMRTDSTVAGYRKVIAQKVETRRHAVEVQLALKNVVKEWKNLLIHGHDEDGAKYLDKLHDAQKEVREMTTKLLEQPLTPEVAAVVTDFQSQVGGVEADYAGAWEHWGKNPAETASAIDKRVYGKGKAAQGTLDKSVELLGTESVAAMKDLDAENQSAQRRTIILMVVVFGGIAAAAWVIARSITKPIAELSSAVARISDADASELRFRTGDDEIGRLGAAYQDLLAYIGEFSAATEKLAAGDFSAKVKARSERDLLAARFASVTTTLQRALGEVGSLVNAAREGRLDQRADATTFAGTYRDVIASVNDLMDAVRGPIDEAVRVMERMAQRDLRSTMNGRYGGDFGRLAHAVNTALEDVSASIGRVSSASEQLTLGSSEIQRASGSLAQTTTEMASAVAAISERTAKLSGAAEQAAARARDGEKAASSVAALATAGVRRMDQMSAAMNKIKESASATGRIMQAINEIAFQTNLLALNAAVEAARAGDAGKGFAVVAEEVRSLALRSAESASNTGRLIEDAVRAADDGVAVNTEATRSLHELATEIHRVAGEISTVATIVDDQQTGLVEIEKAVGEISLATQNTAALAEESASTADVLDTHGNKLRQMVDAFKIGKESAPTANVGKVRTPRPVTLPPRPGRITQA
jgi:methyl-accepting chemotaxis protein